MLRKHWSQENISILTVNWELGKTATQIGLILGMTRNAVIGKKNRLKLPARRVANAAPRPARVRGRSNKALTKSIPPTFVKIQELDPDNQGIPISQLEWAHGLPSSCRAIIRESKGEKFYCGMDVSPNQSYCSGHCMQFLNGYVVPKIMAAG